jgi:PAS domain S-box-containing protein
MPRSRARDRVTVPVLLILAAIVGLGVLLRVRYLGDEMMTRWRAVLEGGSLTTQATVDEWFEERTADASELAGSVAQRASLPRAAAEHAPPLQSILSPLMRRGRFVRIWIVDAQGAVLARSHNDSLRSAERAAIAQALSSGDVTRSSVMPTGAHAAFLSFAAPVVLPAGVPDGGRAPVAVVLRSDVVRSFAPWAAGRPNAAMSLLATPDSAGPIVIAACPEQDVPVCINQYAPGGASTPAMVALARRDTFGIFIALDGMRVLAHTRYDAKLDWGVVRRVRYSDALVPLYREIAIEGAFLAVLLALAGVGAYAANRGRRARWLGEQRDAARWLRAVVDASTDGIVSLDATFTITMVNDAVGRMLGRSGESLIGQPALTLFPVDWHGSLDQSLRHFADSTALNAPIDGPARCIALCDDGRLLPVEVSLGRALRSGAPLFVLGLRDVSERVRAEQFMQGQRAVLERIAAGAPATETMAALLAVMEREAPTMRCAVYELNDAHQLTRVAAGPGFPATVAGLQELPTDAGGAIPLKSADGRTIGAFACSFEGGRAATPRELGLAGAAVQLASIALSSARAAAALRRSERLAAVGKLVSGVAHELNNPLSSIMHFTEDLLADTRTAQDREALGVIRDQARRSRAIVRDLLSFVQQRRVSGEALALHEIVAAAALAMRPGLTNAGVTLHVHASGEGPRVLADRAGIEQIVANLVSNAAYAAGRGGDVWVRTEAAGDSCHLVVEDSGPGIPDHALSHIFDPFFTTKPTGEGTGLGLSVTLGIVEQLDGRIAVDRPKGRGARFTVTLPCTDDVAPPATEAVSLPGAALLAVPPVAAETGSERMRTVLIIDDEPTIRAALRRFFVRRGWHVEESGDGRKGLAAIREESAHFDLVISDLRMPGLSGIELHDLLLTERPDLLERFVFSTGDVASADAASFVQRTSCPVLQKPFELRMLDEIIAAQARGATAEHMIV